MVTKEEATALVQRWLDTSRHRHRFVVCRVDEHPWGWMFLYDSERHLQTGNDLDLVLGTCPVFVTREDGRLHDSVASSLYPAEEHVRLFEEKLEGNR